MTDRVERKEETSYPGTDSNSDSNNEKSQANSNNVSSITSTNSATVLPSSDARDVGQGDAGKSKKPSNKKCLREKIMESIQSSRDDDSGVYSKEDSRHPDLTEDNAHHHRPK